MRMLLKLTGWVILFGSGLIIWWAYLSFWLDWLGFLGGLIAFFVAPGAILFPAIAWIKTGVFPFGYFILWGIGLFGGGFFIWLGSVGEE